MSRMGRDVPSSAEIVPPPLLDHGPGHRTTASFGLWPFFELARRNELSIEEFCKLAGIEPSAMRDPDMRFSQALCNRVAELAYERFGPETAMAAAMTVEAGHFQLLELVARTAPTLADGIEQVCRFFPLLHNGGRMTHELGAGGSHAMRWWPPSDYSVHHAYVELSFAVALLGARRETSDETLRPSAVWFTHPAPAKRALFERVFGKHVHFAMPYAQIAFGAAAAKVPLRRKNVEVHAAAVDIANDLLVEPDDES